MRDRALFSMHCNCSRAGLYLVQGRRIDHRTQVNWLISTQFFSRVGPCRINGLTHINLTKLDCLDALDTIKLGVEYQIDGQTLPSLPADLSILEAVNVKYEDIPGWKSDISKCRTWEDLPENARKYIARIEELVGVKCKWIGVGPGRDAIVVQP